MVNPFVLVLMASSYASAHQKLVYPPWRGDSFEEGRSQWIWPCANVTQEVSANNRTLWPTTGGSVVIDDEHEWALTYINIGLGNEVTSFNVSLIAALNQTSNGTLCLLNLAGEAMDSLGARNGLNGSIQVVTIHTEGNALYNCADITFSDDAEVLDGGECRNDTGVGAVYVGNIDATATNSSSSSEVSESASSSSSTGAGSGVHIPSGVLVLVPLLFGALA